jgi:RNA polymerase sigma factor (TIGR02999 family)
MTCLRPVYFERSQPAIPGRPVSSTCLQTRRKIGHNANRGPGGAELNPQTDGEITDALVALREGSPGAMDRLMPLVYDQLRRVAHRQLGAEPTGHTLTTTALVHEAYLKLVDQTRAQWQDRAHFFAIAARAMRRILIDYARRHRAARRGGGPDGPPTPVSLDTMELSVAERAEALLALDEALDRLAEVDARLAHVVECRFFAGLTEAETATALEVSQRTVAREWALAKGWLYQELRSELG